MHRDTRICWACSFRWTDTPSCKVRAEMYERAVEYIEAWDGEFTIARLWDTFCTRYRLVRYSWHTIFANAVHDMARHGLVRCVAKGKDGRRCLGWVKVDVQDTRGREGSYLGQRANCDLS